MRKIFFFFIIFCLQISLLNAEPKTDAKSFLKKLSKKADNIKTFHADLVSTGYDQDNKVVPVKITYWKDRDKIKKIISDNSETVTTYINGDSFIVHYNNSNIILNNNIKNLSDTELTQFKMQNHFIEFYKMKEILKKFDISDFSDKNGTAELLLISKQNKDKIRLFFDAVNCNIKKIIISSAEQGQDQNYDYTVIFNKISINEKISDSIFRLPPDMSKIKRIDESEYY